MKVPQHFNKSPHSPPSPGQGQIPPAIIDRIMGVTRDLRAFLFPTPPPEAITQYQKEALKHYKEKSKIARANGHLTPQQSDLLALNIFAYHNFYLLIKRFCVTTEDAEVWVNFIEHLKTLNNDNYKPGNTYFMEGLIRDLAHATSTDPKLVAGLTRGVGKKQTKENRDIFYLGTALEAIIEKFKTSRTVIAAIAKNLNSPHNEQILTTVYVISDIIDTNDPEANGETIGINVVINTVIELTEDGTRDFATILKRLLEPPITVPKFNTIAIAANKANAKKKAKKTIAP